MLAFEDRGNLGAFGAPEVHRPGPEGPGPKSDVYSFAAIIVNALTAMPDPAQVQRLEDKPVKKVRKALEKALEPNPAKRARGFKKILRGLGAQPFETGVAGGSSDEEGLDKRIVIPAGILIVVLLGFLLMPSGDTKKGPPPQANAPAAPEEGRTAASNPPGMLEKDDRLTVVSSYIYAPPDPEDEAPEVDQEAAAEHMSKAREALDNVKKYNDDDEYRHALEFYAKAVRARGGEESAEDRAFYESILREEKVREQRQKLIERIEKGLLEEGTVGAALIPYNSLALIDPSSNAAAFFERNSRAPVREIERVGGQGDEARGDEDEDDGGAP